MHRIAGLVGVVGFVVGCASDAALPDAREPDRLLDSEAGALLDGPAPSWSRSTSVPTAEPVAVPPPAASAAAPPPAPPPSFAVATLAAGANVDGRLDEWIAPADGPFARVAVEREGLWVAGRVAGASDAIELVLAFDEAPEAAVGVVLKSGFVPLSPEGCSPALASAGLPEASCRKQLAQQRAVIDPILARFEGRFAIEGGKLVRRAAEGTAAIAVAGARGALITTAGVTAFEAFLPVEALPLRRPSAAGIELTATTLPAGSSPFRGRLEAVLPLGYAPSVALGLAPFFDTMETGEITQLLGVAAGLERDRLVVVGAPYRPNKQAPIRSLAREITIERKAVVAEDGPLRVVLVSTHALPVLGIERAGRVVAADVERAGTITPKPGLSYEVLGHAIRPAGIDVLVKQAYTLPWSDKAESIELVVLRAKRDFTLETIGSTPVGTWAKGTVALATSPDLSGAALRGKNAEDASKPLAVSLAYDSTSDRYVAR